MKDQLQIAIVALFAYMNMYSMQWLFLHEKQTELIAKKEKKMEIFPTLPIMYSSHVQD